MDINYSLMYPIFKYIENNYTTDVSHKLSPKYKYISSFLNVLVSLILLRKQKAFFVLEISYGI